MKILSAEKLLGKSFRPLLFTLAALSLGCIWTFPGMTATARAAALQGQSTGTKESFSKSTPAKASETGKKPADPKSPKPADPAPEMESYRIGVEDALQIDVWKEPELSMPVVVRPDGVITLPLVNDLHVVGLTPKELQDLLTQRLRAFVNEPQVTVIVRDIRSRKVFLVGQVARPGPYYLNGHKTALQLLVEGGGLVAFAKSGSIYVLRRDGGRSQRIHFDYKKALSGKDPKADLELVPGDMVIVP